MAYFYVKNSLGTRVTGGGTTKRSGSFTALGADNVYATIANAIADGAGSGDYICVSDAHSFDSGSTSINYNGPTSGDFLYVICVEDANVDTGSAEAVSASELCTGTVADIGFGGRICVHGLYFSTGDNLQSLTPNATALFNNCILDVEDILILNQDGAYFSFCDCTVNGGDSTSGISVLGGATFTAEASAFTGYTAQLFQGSGANGGCTMRLIGCDVSSVTGQLFSGAGGVASTDDTMSMYMQGCTLNATAPAWLDETLENYSHRLTATNTSGTSSASEYQYYVESYGGAVEEQDDAGIYRDESTAFPSGTKISLKCVTNAGATMAAPFWFGFPTRYAELSSASTDVIRVYLASTSILYDSDVWVEASYPDGTTKQIYKFLSTRHTNIMDANGTALTDDSGSTWKDGASDLVGYNEYQIDLDTSGDAGSDCIPIIQVYVAKPSATIYFCPTIGLS